MYLLRLSGIGKIAGGILLIAGTAIGAGMLALPVETAPGGFFPSLLMFSLTWMAMTYTAFLILEGSVALGGKANLISMSRKTMGLVGEGIAWSAYLLLLYALIAAYITGVGSILAQSVSAFGKPLPDYMGSLGVILLVAPITYSGIHLTDRLNRILLVILVITFIIILTGLLPRVTLPHLSYIAPLYTPLSLPIIVTAFGYHIIIPSLYHYLDNDRRKTGFCIIVGSLLILGTYFVWQLAVLGALPLEGKGGLLAVLSSGKPPLYLTLAIQKLANSAVLGTVVKIFSFCAVLTSLLGILLSLWDFLADGLKVHRMRHGKFMLSGLTFLPPLAFAWFFPGGFLLALGYGGIFVAILLGLLPIAICWIGRRRSFWPVKRKKGRFAMVITGIFFLCIIVAEIFQNLVLVNT